MKLLPLIILIHFSMIVFGQDTTVVFDGHKWEAPYALPIPKGWSTERFPIPISFAPQIPYSGVEDIRFSPGWARVTSDQYWSYAFLWYLQGQQELDTEILGSHLKSYYTGLIGVNGTSIPADKIIPVVTAFSEQKREDGDVKTFSGTIRMVDYMRKEPMLLNCKVHLKFCPGRNNTYIFFKLSPQPISHEIWVSLDRLWFDFRCDAD